MRKVLASLMLSLCLCLPGWGQKNAHREKDLDRQIRGAVRDLELQIPELLKGIRIRLENSEFQLQIPEINVRVPEILLPDIQIHVPVNVQIPAITLPEIRVQIPKLEIQIPISLE